MIPLGAFRTFHSVGFPDSVLHSSIGGCAHLPSFFCISAPCLDLPRARLCSSVVVVLLLSAGSSRLVTESRAAAATAPSLDPTLAKVGIVLRSPVPVAVAYRHTNTSRGLDLEVNEDLLGPIYFAYASLMLREVQHCVHRCPRTMIVNLLFLAGFPFVLVAVFVSFVFPSFGARKSSINNSPLGRARFLPDVLDEGILAVTLKLRTVKSSIIARSPVAVWAFSTSPGFWPSIKNMIDCRPRDKLRRKSPLRYKSQFYL